jgi:hypothetical protein
MTEDQLRALVRQIVAERMAAGARHDHASPPLPEPTSHFSHGLLRMAPSVQKGQPCVIEPHVACGLCGFCQSLGH